MLCVWESLAGGERKSQIDDLVLYSTRPGPLVEGVIPGNTQN